MKTLLGNKINILSNKANIKELLLENRGITDTKKYFSPSLSDLYDPFLFKGMDAVVDRILKAKDNGERVVIFGDYDVDGVSSTALLVKFLSEIGVKVSYRLPHRVKDGYGLKKHFVDDIASKNVKLLITVDCGTRDIEPVEYAIKSGIDVIISDHHMVPEIIPSGIIALINPKGSSCKYPNKDLSGSGVAYKILHAISLKLFSEKKVSELLKKYCDFAMLGTVADCMNLTGENRIIAYNGLSNIKNSHSLGLKKLIEGHDGNILNSDLIGYRVAPRLNAAGRMDTPYTALKALLAGESFLDEILEEIESLNTKRKLKSEKFLEQAMKKVNFDKQVLFFDSQEIEHGIIGLIAGRLCNEFNKVAIVLREDGDYLTGSARSPEFINIFELLNECSSLFEYFGGHHQAAGFTIKKSNFIELKKCLENLVVINSNEQDKVKTINIDCEIGLSNINDDLLNFVEKMHPFGAGNSKPLFLLKTDSRFALDYMGKDFKHLKFFIPGVYLDIKAFGLGQFYKELKKSSNYSLIFELEKNFWNGKTRMALNVKDFIL